MNYFYYKCAPRFLLLIAIACSTLIFGSMASATEVVNPEKSPSSEKSLPGPLGLAVTGASAGITTEYFEQAVIDALAASGIFSAIEDSGSEDVIMPMIGADGVFSGVDSSSDAPYFLSIRVTKVETPSFSMRMTVSINAIWSLYRTAEKIELLHENIYSTYTGGVFEGGISGANRVRVAMEGAERENIRIGIEKLGSLDFEQK